MSPETEDAFDFLIFFLFFLVILYLSILYNDHVLLAQRLFLSVV